MTSAAKRGKAAAYSALADRKAARIVCDRTTTYQNVLFTSWYEYEQRERFLNSGKDAAVRVVKQVFDGVSSEPRVLKKSDPDNLPRKDQ
jgi:hypothetical protein